MKNAWNHVSQWWANYSLLFCISCKLRLVCTFLEWLEKKRRKNNISWHVKITWNSHFSVHKSNVIGIQPHPSVYILTTAACATESRSQTDCRVLKAKSIDHLALYREHLQTLQVEKKGLEQDFGSDPRLCHLKLKTSQGEHRTHEEKSLAVYRGLCVERARIKPLCVENQGQVSVSCLCPAPSPRSQAILAPKIPVRASWWFPWLVPLRPRHFPCRWHRCSSSLRPFAAGC